ncbi:hypothetical protein EGW08_006238 [Elysia chlorotica]|uniref:Uncharacterized protein n=1 Tax=Elysia chlorotica TaxID=188477 RepID=A0A3S0ZSZ7_ELYCH|nr:hypothetical protein EGW08_006238 [Elysia chlorotica]
MERVHWLSVVSSRRFRWFGHVVILSIRGSGNIRINTSYQLDFTKTRPPKRWSNNIRDLCGVPLLTAEKRRSPLLTVEKSSPYSGEVLSLQWRSPLLTVEKSSPYSGEVLSLQRRSPLLTAEKSSPYSGEVLSYSGEVLSLQWRSPLLTAEKSSPYSGEVLSLQRRSPLLTAEK